MYKIAITGKANSGKNTVGKLLIKSLFKNTEDSKNHHFIAFADPLKKMTSITFPEIPRKWLYGPSKYRAQVIPGAFKNGEPLTVRQVLIDLGNDFGRKYKSDIWIKNFDHTFNKLAKKQASAIVVTDVRFRNEFDHLKTLGFFQIRLVRDAQLKISDASESNQDSIRDDEYDAIIVNNSTLADLKQRVNEIVSQMPIQ